MNAKVFAIVALLASVAHGAIVNIGGDNLIFVSNAVFAADATLAGFDAACWTEANNQLGQEFVAVVSTSAGDAKSRIPDSGSYVNANGDQVAADLDALFPASSAGYSLDNPILTIDGSASSALAWTGSAAIDTTFAGDILSCESFTTLTPTVGTFGASGDSSSTGVAWWTSTFSECGTAQNAVYCAPKKGGSAIQDPIFHGFDGSRFEFQGIAGQIFNLISASNFNLNAKFVGVEHGTFMGALGFKIGSHEIFVDANSTVIADDEYLKESAETEDFKIVMRNSGKFIIVEGNGWNVEIKVVASNRLDLAFYADSKVITGEVNGVIGQTLNSETDFNTEVSDFFVSGGIFSADFATNVFGSDVDAKEIKRSKLEGVLKAGLF